MWALCEACRGLGDPAAWLPNALRHTRIRTRACTLTQFHSLPVSLAGCLASCLSVPLKPACCAPRWTAPRWTSVTCLPARALPLPRCLPARPVSETLLPSSRRPSWAGRESRRPVRDERPVRDARPVRETRPGRESRTPVPTGRFPPPGAVCRPGPAKNTDTRSRRHVAAGWGLKRGRACARLSMGDL